MQGWVKGVAGSKGGEESWLAGKKRTERRQNYWKRMEDVSFELKRDSNVYTRVCPERYMIIEEQNKLTKPCNNFIKHGDSESCFVELNQYSCFTIYNDDETVRLLASKNTA